MVRKLVFQLAAPSFRDMYLWEFIKVSNNLSPEIVPTEVYIIDVSIILWVFSLKIDKPVPLCVPACGEVLGVNRPLKSCFSIESTEKESGLTAYKSQH